jgi:hypothetical protein
MRLLGLVLEDAETTQLENVLKPEPGLTIKPARRRHRPTTAPASTPGAAGLRHVRPAAALAADLLGDES